MSTSCKVPIFSNSANGAVLCRSESSLVTVGLSADGRGVCLLFRCFAGTEFWLGLPLTVLGALQTVYARPDFVIERRWSVAQLFSRTSVRKAISICDSSLTSRRSLKCSYRYLNSWQDLQKPPGFAFRYFAACQMQLNLLIALLQQL